MRFSEPNRLQIYMAIDKQENRIYVNYLIINSKSRFKVIKKAVRELYLQNQS